MEKLATILDPKSFIKLHCVLSGTIPILEIKRLSFKDRTNYDLAIVEIARSFPTLKFKFGQIGTKISTQNIQTLSFVDLGIVPKYNDDTYLDNFMLKCVIYISGPNVASDSYFYREDKLFKLTDLTSANNFEQELQSKFVSLLTEINSTYNSNYVFSFKFSRIFVKCSEKMLKPVVSPVGSLMYSINVKHTENVESVTFSNKKRKMERDSEYDSDDSDDQ